jgi:hypothetical protein
MNSKAVVDRIADGLIREIGPEARKNAEAAARQALLNSEAETILTFVTPGGTRYRPSVDADYAKALWCFVREKPMDGRPLDSAVTEPVVQAIESSVLQTLNSEKASQVVAGALAQAAALSQTTVRSELKQDAKFISKEIISLSGMSPAAIVADQITDIASQQAMDVLNTSAGKALLAAIAQVASTAMGKVMIMKLIQASAITLAKSTALKAAVLGALKKVGILVVVKTVIVKALAVMAPGLLTVKIPVFWILLPFVGLFIAHEMGNMPNKLAKELPGKVGGEIDKAFPAMARSFAEMILAQAVSDVARTGTQG